MLNLYGKYDMEAQAMLVIMPEIDEILSRLTERQQVSLQRFVAHLDVERAWPRTLSYGVLLASKARSIYQRGESR